MRLFRVITNEFKSETDGMIHLLTLEGATEEYFLGKATDNNGSTQLQLDINDIRELIEKTRDEINKLNNKGIDTYAIVVEPSLRKRIFEIYNRFEIQIAVLSHSEIDPRVPFNIESNIALELEQPGNSEI